MPTSPAGFMDVLMVVNPVPAGSEGGVDDDLVCGAVAADGVERVAVLLEREAVGDDAVRSCPAGAQGDQGCREGVDLGERALDRQLSPEDLVRRHPDAVLLVRDPVEQGGSAVPGQRQARL